MFTGENDPYKLSYISRFDGRESLNIWDGEQCDKVQGSDGATFNPYIQEKETLWFFNDQLCRSMPLVFEKNVQSANLPGYRYVFYLDRVFNFQSWSYILEYTLNYTT